MAGETISKERNPMMKRILVAGATGYLGSFVAREFKSQGHFVRALARSPEKLDNLDPAPDEIVQGEITRPETLANVCDGIDIVFSSVGITRQKDKLTFRDVDYQGNKNLLEAALKAGVEKFIYVSVFNGPNLPHLAIIKAHEDFVDELKISGINYAVIRPTGYFSDMQEFIKMAQKGRIYLIGKGDNKGNPIHGADLAKTCVDAIAGEHQEIDVGGPQIMTYRDIAELAFQCLGKAPRISSLPVWLMKMAVTVTKMFSTHNGELLAFFTTAMTRDSVAPQTGTHTLKAYYQGLEASH
jgi:uncharacterized protein YbjT (DUF2867 family)